MNFCLYRNCCCKSWLLGSNLLFSPHQAADKECVRLHKIQEGRYFLHELKSYYLNLWKSEFCIDRIPSWLLRSLMKRNLDVSIRYRQKFITSIANNFDLPDPSSRLPTYKMLRCCFNIAQMVWPKNLRTSGTISYVVRLLRRIPSFFFDVLFSSGSTSRLWSFCFTSLCTLCSSHCSTMLWNSLGEDIDDQASARFRRNPETWVEFLLLPLMLCVIQISGDDSEVMAMAHWMDEQHSARPSAWPCINPRYWVVISDAFFIFRSCQEVSFILTTSCKFVFEVVALYTRFQDAQQGTAACTRPLSRWVIFLYIRLQDAHQAKDVCMKCTSLEAIKKWFLLLVLAGFQGVHLAVTLCATKFPGTVKKWWVMLSPKQGSQMPWITCSLNLSKSEGYFCVLTGVQGAL